MSSSPRLVATAALAAVIAGAGVGITSASALAAPTVSTAAPATPQTGVDAQTRHDSENRLPRTVMEWEAAWNGGDPQQLAALFVRDARYTDHAFGATFTGSDGIARWSSITAESIDDAQIDVHSAQRRGRHVEVRWTFSGHLVGAPTPFSVPAVTLQGMKGQLIVTNDDYYDLAELLRQSGLPADTTFG